MVIFNKIISLLPESNRFELIWKLAQVDFKKRYYNDKLGLFWALLNPVFQVLIYWVVFTVAFKKSIAGIDNYALFLFSGLIFWMAFTETSRKGMRVLYQKKYLIQNIKDNKIDLYLSNTLSVFIGFHFNIFVFITLCLIFGIELSFNVLYLPLLIINLFLISMGTGMILSFIHIYFKDINHIVDIIFLLGFWSSGIMFDSKVILDNFKAYYYLNPFIGLIQNSRNILLYGNPIDIPMMSINLFVSILLVVIGNYLIINKSYLVYERM